MKTFLLDIIPRLKDFSKKLDSVSVLTNKHWVVIDEELGKKVVFIFREKNSQLLISDNGKIEKGTWEYLGNNSLLVDRESGSYLFKHGFIDDYVLALKVDGKEEYALLVNEQKFEENLNSLTAITAFLEHSYLDQKNAQVAIPQKRAVEPPTSAAQQSTSVSAPSKALTYELDWLHLVVPASLATDHSSNDGDVILNVNSFPEIVKVVAKLRERIKRFNNQISLHKVIALTKHYIISQRRELEHGELVNLLANKNLPIESIQKMFAFCRVEFINDIEATECVETLFRFCGEMPQLKRQLESYIHEQFNQEPELFSIVEAKPLMS